MLAPHRALQPCAHFIRTVRTLRSASYYGVTSTSLALRELARHRRHLSPPSIEQFAKTLGASFATMAKIKVNKLASKSYCLIVSPGGWEEGF